MGRGCADSLESQEFPIIIPLPLQQRGGRKHWRDPRAVLVARLRAASAGLGAQGRTRFRARRRARGGSEICCSLQTKAPQALRSQPGCSPTTADLGTRRATELALGSPSSSVPPAPCHHGRGFPSTFKAGVLSWCQGPPLQE